MGSQGIMPLVPEGPNELNGLNPYMHVRIAEGAQLSAL